MAYLSTGTSSSASMLKPALGGNLTVVFTSGTQGDEFSTVPDTYNLNDAAASECKMPRSTVTSSDLYQRLAFLAIEDCEGTKRRPDMSSVTHVYPSQIISVQIISDATRNYVVNVVQIQYLLGNRYVLPDMIWKSINLHNDSRDAVALLSNAYYGRQQDPNFSVFSDIASLERIRNIGVSLTSKALFTADDAMAALHVVSLYLFDGGRGKWNRFLHIAVLYVHNVLQNPTYGHNYPEALENADPKVQFVVKTTIWFDVLAAITTQKPPILIEYIRQLFKPGFRRSWAGLPYTYSMLDPMGCDNEVVWALAETAYLSYWKEGHMAAGDLSNADLVSRVAEIERHLAPNPQPFRPQPNDDARRRFLSSEIFRRAARLFLVTVENGDYPCVKMVRTCVDQCYEAIMYYPTEETPLGCSAILRSTVFAVFICGALTFDPKKRMDLTTHLERNSGPGDVGNVLVVLKILKVIWDSRGGVNAPVRWRNYLRHHEFLLV